MAGRWGSRYPGKGSSPSVQVGNKSCCTRYSRWVDRARALASALRLDLACRHVGKAGAKMVSLSCKEIKISE
jgi:hypothetical protein